MAGEEDGRLKVMSGVQAVGALYLCMAAWGGNPDVIIGIGAGAIAGGAHTG